MQNAIYCDCEGNIEDCIGECGGDALIDDCFICDGDNVNQDCAEECFGDAILDECDVCDDNPDNDCIQDCDNEWGGGMLLRMSVVYVIITLIMIVSKIVLVNGGGDAIIDDCGICDGPGLNEEGCCGDDIPDCFGECGGDAVVDGCGVCDGDGLSCVVILNLGPFDSSGSIEILYNSPYPIAFFQFNLTGLALTSASGGAAADAGIIVSASGITVTGFSLDNLEIAAGAGILTILSFSDVTAGTTELSLGTFGSITDIDGNAYDMIVSGSIDHGDPDCVGNYYGTAIIDECGICDGPGLNEQGCCGDDIPDCAGECGGDAVVDECGVCDGDGIAEYACDCDGNVEDCAGDCGGSAVEDECGECGGDGIADGACDCDGNVEDCAGDCGGSAIEDECGVCNGNGIADGACDCDGNVEDCTDECGGDAVVDECGVCDGPGLNEEGCCGDDIPDCADECDGTAVVDECSVCGGPGAVFECIDDYGFFQGYWCSQEECEEHLLDASDVLPTELFLSQNYPNPFNPTTVIEYGVPMLSKTNISLYDLQGRRLKTLINSMHRPGYYKIILTLDDLHSGIYIVKIVSENAIKIRKIALVK